jgi:diguanylate cyclase (GGDEF)-like protein
MAPPPVGDGGLALHRIQPVNPQADTLLIAAAALAVAATSLTGFGLRRQRYRGWSWWVAAIWLTTLGALVAAGSHSASAQALAGLLLMQWPVAALIGLRQFHARHAIPGRVRIDTAVLATAALVSAAVQLVGTPGAAWVAAFCALGVHVYAAALLFRGAEGHDGTPLHSLAAAMAVAAFAPVLAMSPAGSTGLWPDPLPLRAVGAALGSVVMAFVALTLVCERSERQLRDSRRRLRALANMDALTQVPNRRHFHELAALALRTDPPASAVLMLFDIDHFKHINDHFGHAAGDRALTLVSGSLLEHLRSQDVAGRHGGDEFVLLLRRADTAAAMRVAARIVAGVQLRAAEAQLPRLTLSFGMVQVADGERVDDALRRADQAMYEAKRQGRACAVAAAGDEAHPVFGESQRMGLTAA